MKVLVTGAAGFIGAFLCKKLLENNNIDIIGVDNLNDYYDVSLKDSRLKMPEFFHKIMILNLIKKLVAMQKGDAPITYADTSDLEKDFGFKPSTSLREGLRKFASWYFDYYVKGNK